MLRLIAPFKQLWHFLLFSAIFSITINLIFWSNSFNDPKIFLYGFLWSLTIFLTQWIGNVYFGLKVGELYSWLKEPKKRLFFGVLTIVVYSSIAFIIVQFLMNYLFFGTITDNPSVWILNQLKITVPISLIISFAFNSIGFFYAWKNAEINAQKLETEMLRYKYESLQNQINPHFLFNSFNVLSELVVEDQDLAVKFINKLSSLYRYVLESKEKELVPLSEELEFIESFIFLLKIRFEDKINFKIEIEIDKIEGKYVVPMSLQLLIENSVKHNIATNKKQLTINVLSKQTSIEVSNNLQVKSSMEHSTKTGLTNLVEQYNFFTDQEVKINKTTESFIVEIPLLEKSSKQ